MTSGQIWREEIDTSLSFMDSKKLVNYQLPEAQLRLLLKQYRKETAFPMFNDFCYYMENRFASNDVPENVSCAGFLSGNEAFIRLADELETLRGAWVPTEATEYRITQLRAALSRLL